MKNKQIMSLVAATAVSFPALAIAGGTPVGGEVDSTIDFSMRVTMEGDSVERPNGVTSRFKNVRLGAKEFIEEVGEMRRIESAEVEEPAFPRGSRLMLIDDDVWIVDRRGNQLMNVSDYFSFSVASEPIEAGTFRKGSRNSHTLYLARVGINLGMVVLPGADTAEGDDEISAEAQGVATNRFSYRSRESRTRFTETTTSSTTANVQGAGTYRGSPIVVQGPVRVNGRETNTETFSSGS